MTQEADCGLLSICGGSNKNITKQQHDGSALAVEVFIYFAVVHSKRKL